MSARQTPSKVAPDAVTDWFAEVQSVCDVGRRPPLTPAAFEAELRESFDEDDGPPAHPELVLQVDASLAHRLREYLGASARYSYAALGCAAVSEHVCGRAEPGPRSQRAS